MHVTAACRLDVGLDPTAVIAVLRAQSAIVRGDAVLCGGAPVFTLRWDAVAAFDEYALFRAELHGQVLTIEGGSSVSLRSAVRADSGGMGRALATAAVYGGVNLIVDAMSYRATLRRLEAERTALFHLVSTALRCAQIDRTPQTPYRVAS